jgi:ABC-type glycerol-3-phosphate transport system permease component
LLFTTAVTAIPQYNIMARLGMINTYSALIFPTLSNTMGVFLCIQYLSTIPGEMLEAGKIDGAGEYRIWWDLVLPNIKPVLATVLIFQFQGVWNQTGSNLIFNESLKLLPTALSQITSAGISRAGVGSAASLLLMLPPILVFVIAQNSVMETMVHSGIKG